MIAVCLLTCERFEYTETTLRTFATYNDRTRFKLYHADDASTDARVPALAQSYGFTTVVKSASRKGWLAMRLALFEFAARQADWILFLENDCEWARPFPWTLFEFLDKHSDFCCLRLYGKFKDRAQQEPCMAYHKLNRVRPVRWKPIKRAPEPAEVGLIHWSAQPSVTRSKELLEHHRIGREPAAMTARVVENVTYHIGTARTGERQKAQRLAYV